MPGNSIDQRFFADLRQKGLWFISMEDNEIKNVRDQDDLPDDKLNSAQVQTAQNQIAGAAAGPLFQTAKKDYQDSITELLVPNYNKAKTSLSMDSRTECLYQLTNEYLHSLNVNSPPAPRDIQNDLLAKIDGEFDAINGAKGKSSRWRKPDGLEPFMIAQIICYLYPVASIASAGLSGEPEYDLLGLYQDKGRDKGIYVTNDNMFRVLIREFNRGLTTKQIEECKSIIKDTVPRVEKTTSKNLIAVDNGIFDYDRKILMPFSPAFVFTTKCYTPYNPKAKNPVIQQPDGTTWDIESWFNTLSDNPQIVHTLKQVVGAIIRPNTPFNTSAWFYSETGCNGKGCLCELMRQLAGEGNCVSISLDDMGKDFQLEPLTHAIAIVCDENDVGAKLDKAANLKAIVTHDTIQINRKFKQPIAYKFCGFMVQCLNEMPEIKDKSDSFFRRQLFIPFDKCFTGHENKAIKHDYLHRPDVLEYVVKQILESDYYNIDIPDECRLAQKEYRIYNDPVRGFAEEMLPRLVWSFVPMTFLFDLFKAWYDRLYPGGKPEPYKDFAKDLASVIREYPEWHYIDSAHRRVLHTGEMAEAEPLIDEYELKNWVNPRYKSAEDRDKACRPAINSDTKFSGLERVSNSGASPDDDN